MVTFNLKEEMKGKDLADKLTAAFTNLAENETQEIIIEGWFKDKKKTVKTYYFNQKKKQEFEVGDSGPKVCDKKVSLFFGYQSEVRDKQGYQMAHQITIDIPLESSVKTINLKCYSYWGQEYESDSMDNLETMKILQTAISTVYKALYANKEEEKIKEQGTGDIVY